MASKRSAALERARCVGLVAEERHRLQMLLLARPRASNRSNIERFIHILAALEVRISDGKNSHTSGKLTGISAAAVGEFSLEEIAQAEAIMAEQNRNPFDWED